jgi:uncharacterized protein
VKQLLIIFLVVGAIISNGFAQTGIPERPQPPRLVNDFAGILTEPQTRALEQKLVSFSDTTGTQIAVVTVADLAGNDRSEFTYGLLNKWGVGQAGRDNGIVIMVKPKTAQEQGQAFIAQGLGLEGIIPDVTAKRIIENEMIPHFRNGNYFEGIDRAADILMGLAAQEFTAADYDKTVAEPHPIVALLPLLFFVFMFFIFSRAKGRNSSLGHGTSLWTLLMLMNAGNRRHSGSWGNFTGGGGGFGGGGFGGFGGGRSGGGGAGGSW